MWMTEDNPDPNDLKWDIYLCGAWVILFAIWLTILVLYVIWNILHPKFATKYTRCSLWTFLSTVKPVYTIISMDVLSFMVYLKL